MGPVLPGLLGLPGLPLRHTHSSVNMLKLANGSNTAVAENGKESQSAN